MKNHVEDNKDGNPTDHPQTQSNANHEEESKPSWRRKAINWLINEHESDWLKNMRGMLSLVATMIATMSFQVAMAPADISIQEYKSYYAQFQIYNTICFVASLSVTLLLVSGIPLNHRFPIWMLSIGMIITLSCLALTYLYGLFFVMHKTDVSESYSKIYKYTIGTWILLIGTVALYLTIRFLARFVNTCIKPPGKRLSHAPTQRGDAPV